MTEKINYKELKAKLDAILDWFEGGDVDVDEAVKKYEEAKKIISQIEDYLSAAENKITKLK